MKNGLERKPRTTWANVIPGQGETADAARTEQTDERVDLRTHPAIVFPSAAERPTFACYDKAFFIGNKRYRAGVYYHETKQKTDEDGDVLIDHWICSVLKVICIVRARRRQRAQLSD
jgi:hypothetical protein